MPSKFLPLMLFCFLILCAGQGVAQTAGEAAVIESVSRHFTFADSGASTTSVHARIQVKTSAGVQQYGLLRLGYEEKRSKLNVDYVRVTKPDGTVVETPAADFQDVSSQITQTAPMYTSLREKHIPIKGLAPGDTLEYQYSEEVTQPLIPGQFWLEGTFTKDVVVMKDEVLIEVPRQRPLVVKWPKAPVIHDEGDKRTYLWAISNPVHKEPEAKVPRFPGKAEWEPDFQISTFKDWASITSWYAQLQSDRIEAPPELKEKVASLIKDAKTDQEKIDAIYGFVSTRFRYIGVSLGVGRYQPHTASEVNANGFGDCKDKHTLLQAMLKIAGFNAYPALIHSEVEIDKDVPSPAQFDHVITYVDSGKGVWLDSTPEVAPYQYLLPNLRDKEALVVDSTHPGRFIETPEDPPYSPHEAFKITGKLSDDDVLTAHISQSFRSDTEIFMRAAFSTVGQSDWKEVIQRMSYALGFSGIVSNVEIKNVSDTHKPLEFEYDYTRKEFGEWDDHRFTFPVPGMLAFFLKQDAKVDREIPLGTTGATFRYEASIELPADLRATIPNVATFESPNISYSSEPSLNGNVLKVIRELTIKSNAVQPKDAENLKKLSEKILNDENSYIHFEKGNAGEPIAGSFSADARKAFGEASQAYMYGNITKAMADLKTTVALDPRFPGAWHMLGALQGLRGQKREAIESLKREVANYPTNRTAIKALGYGFMAVQRYEEAIPVWEQLKKQDPNDVDGPANEGNALMQLKHYDKAAIEYEAAVKQKPSLPNLRLSLGSSYLKSGSDEKALAAYREAMKLDATPISKNDAAYSLAEEKSHLDVALQWAQEAVASAEKASDQIALADLEPEDYARTRSLEAFWDTLGWAYFQSGDPDKAETFLRAAWELGMHQAESEHLAHLYESQGKQKEAAQFYTLALAERDDKAIHQKLIKLLGPAAGEQAAKFAKNTLSKRRTAELPALAKPGISAQFTAVFNSTTGKIEAKFQDAAAVSESFQHTLQESLHFKFPDANATRLVRDGIVACHVGGCSLVYVELTQRTTLIPGPPPPGIPQ